MQILHDKPHTKRPVIVAAATRLFAERGIDATSMRDIADAAGIREAAIYRHFANKESMSRDIFVSWYAWYGSQLRDIAKGSGTLREKLGRVARLELDAAEKHSEALLYFCENEPRFLHTLPAGVPRAGEILSTMIKEGQKRGEVRRGDAGILADMLSGALCGTALSWIRRGRPRSVRRHADLIAEACWRMIAD